MTCENCGSSHDGSYGSGRFCSEKCSRGFSTKSKRNDINQAVSKIAREQKWAKNLEGYGFKKGFDPRRGIYRGKNCSITDEQRQLGAKARAQKFETDLLRRPWEEMPRESKRKRVILEQSHRCARCGISEWLGAVLILEYHHKDGDRLNDARDNVEALCPNCHSQTETFRGRNLKHIGAGQTKVSDTAFLTALSEQPNIHQALAAVGLVPKGGNYERAKRLRVLEEPSARGRVL